MNQCRLTSIELVWYFQIDLLVVRSISKCKIVSGSSLQKEHMLDGLFSNHSSECWWLLHYRFAYAAIQEGLGVLCVNGKIWLLNKGILVLCCFYQNLRFTNCAIFSSFIILSIMDCFVVIISLFLFARYVDGIAWIRLWYFKNDICDIFGDYWNV